MKQLYVQRCWKSIFYPDITALVLLLTNGNIILSLRIVGLLFVSLVGWNSYRLLRNFIEDKYHALLCTFFLLLHPMIFAIADVYTPDIVLMAVILGFFADYLKKDESKKFYYASIFWFVFGLLNRPAETLMITTAVVARELYLSFLNKQYFKILLTVALTSLCLYIFYVLYINIVSHAELYLHFGALVVLSLVGLWNFKKANNYFSDLANTALLFCTVWYFPTARNFIWWIYGSSIGRDAQLTGGRDGSSNFDFVSRIFKLSGNQNEILIILAIIIALASIAALFTKQGRNYLQNVFSYNWILLLVSVCIPFIVGSFGANADIRYYFGPMSLILVLMMILIYKLCRAYSGSFFGIMVFLTIFSLGFQFTRIFNFQSDFYTKISSGNIYFRFRNEFIPDEVLAFFDEIREVLKEESSNHTRIESLGLVCNLNADLALLMDPWALRTRARKLGFDWYINRSTINQFPDFDSQIKFVKEQNDYLLVGPVNKYCVGDPPGNFISMLAEELIRRDKNNTISELGLKRVGKLDMRSAHTQSYGNAYLFKVLR